MKLRLALAAVAVLIAGVVAASPAGARPDLPCEVILDRLAVRCGPI